MLFKILNNVILCLLLDPKNKILITKWIFSILNEIERNLVYVMDCTENRLCLAFTFFVWVLCIIHGTRKYGF